MPQQDRTSDIVINHESLKQAFDWLLPRELFAGMKVRDGAAWTVRMIAVTAILWAISELPTLTGRFGQARKIVGKIFRWRSKEPGQTYQGFMKVLRSWHLKLQLAIIPHIRQQMKEVLPGQWKIAGYVVFAGDGSRIELARTKSLENAFSPKRRKNQKSSQSKRKGKGKGKSKGGRGRAKSGAKAAVGKKQSAESIAKKENSPQMWLTLFWHIGTGMPWAWRTGPSDSSERGHVEEMLPELPENSLITADAGFVGYDFWSAVLSAGHHIVIRVGANVRLLQNLGYAREYAHTVYLWPDSAARKKQPPLVLRLIVVNNGKRPMYLVTNLTKSQLSDRQAATIYAARWGIELFFRTFKQTFDCRKLRSRTADNAQLELDWSMLGLWCICLAGQRELAENGDEPTELSAAAAIKAFQSTLREYRLRPETHREILWAKLQDAVRDSYARAGSKTSRNYPRKKQRQSTGPPKVTRARKQQIDAAERIKQQQPEFRLPA